MLVCFYQFFVSLLFSFPLLCFFILPRFSSLIYFYFASILLIAGLELRTSCFESGNYIQDSISCPPVYVGACVIMSGTQRRRDAPCHLDYMTGMFLSQRHFTPDCTTDTNLASFINSISCLSKFCFRFPRATTLKVLPQKNSLEKAGTSGVLPHTYTNIEQICYRYCCRLVFGKHLTLISVILLVLKLVLRLFRPHLITASIY